MQSGTTESIKTPMGDTQCSAISPLDCSQLEDFRSGATVEKNPAYCVSLALKVSIGIKRQL